MHKTNARIRAILTSKLPKHKKLSNLLKYLFTMAKIDQSKYYILGSYALREHRNINDLDINMDEKEFLKLQALTDKGFGQIEFYNNQIRWFYDLTKTYNKLTNSREDDFSIEAFQKNPNSGFPTKTYSLGNLRRIRGLSRDKNGHQHFNLAVLLRWKKQMNRPKDKSDIALIKKISS